MKQINCATFEGLEAKVVSVEATMTKGLPSFQIVGIASQAISESKERVKSALLTGGFTFPPKRITVNLSPSELKKEGSHFDLGIALLIALWDHNVDLRGHFIFGELGLDGSVKENALLFALILSLANQCLLHEAIVPTQSLEKLRNIPDIRFIGVSHLQEATALLKGELEAAVTAESAIDAECLHVKGETYYFRRDYPLDFAEVRGQELAKRAALIAAAGMHNLLLEGSPGCGKSMIAKRLRYIMAPLSRRDILDIAKLDSFEGKTPAFNALRPFRSPHHSSTASSIFGGGSSSARIGEVGLAHLGLLFFDELPHFGKNVLEALREPLEDRRIRISRVNSKIEYATDFLFVAAMNPCPCGHLLSTHHTCRCSDLEIERYRNRLSEPFLDRIDLYIQMQSVDAQQKSTFDSRSLHDQVISAFVRQIERGQSLPNGRLDEADIERYCLPSPQAGALLDQATERFGLSFRARNKIRKVARTIADLSGAEQIEKTHLLEALSFRRR
ncbi:MAG: YifB family Mg chelatase-like AAA ATPase [Campylobacterales bacterium]|nr:YifB family Mg chelatase-like AAA ATPase [Campylobacterales bacterium]